MIKQYLYLLQTELSDQLILTFLTRINQIFEAHVISESPLNREVEPQVYLVLFSYFTIHVQDCIQIYLGLTN